MIEGKMNENRWLSLGRQPSTAVAANIDNSSMQTESAPVKDFHCRGYLPHIEYKLLQSITFRLYDSVPKKIIEQWKQSLNDLQGTMDMFALREVARLQKLINQYEDAGYGQCFLGDERIASLVEKTLCFYEGKHYKLIRWCIMPNHVHVLIEVVEGITLSTIVQEWKSYTAHQANKILKRKGKFWMHEYFDRYIRDERHFNNIVNYIDNNPVKAGLVRNPEDWRWCSVRSKITACEDAGRAQ